MTKNELTEKYLNIFRSRIKQIRFNNNWTLEEASEKYSISTNFLSKLENGKRSPTFNTLVNISSGLNVPLSLLLLPDCDSKELDTVIKLFNYYDKGFRKD